MKTYDKIYIQEGAVVRTEKTFDNDVEYIRKDALLEWVKEKQEQMKIETGGCSNMLAAGKLLAYEAIIKKIELL